MSVGKVCGGVFIWWEHGHEADFPEDIIIRRHGFLHTIDVSRQTNIKYFCVPSHFIYKRITMSCEYRSSALPDTLIKCTYHDASSPMESPHIHSDDNVRSDLTISPDILSCVGNTPLVRLNRIGKKAGVKCEVLGKCEYLNVGGSLKDRIAVKMIEDAEAKGLLKEGDVIIEPSSGNTGIGMALAAAVKGYKCIIVMSERMSTEKEITIQSLGATLVRAPNVPYSHPESHLNKAIKLMKEIPNSVILNQYRNEANPIAHYDGTGEEILRACDDRVDMVVIGAGTGGALTGVARKIKERCPDCIVVAVDPTGSIMAEPASMNKEKVFFEIEGIGHDFIPTVCDRAVVDKWYKCTDKESFNWARTLIKEEGLLTGGSCGAMVYCGLQAAKDANLKENQRCVIILPDSIRNYMTKFLNDDWMISRGHIDVGFNTAKTWWWDLDITATKMSPAVTVSESTTIQQTLDTLNKIGADQVPCVDNAGSLVGMATSTEIMSSMIKGDVTMTDPVSSTLFKKYKQTTADITLGKLSCFLTLEPYVVVVSSPGPSKPKPLGMITKMDFLNFINRRKHGENIMAANGNSNGNSNGVSNGVSNGASPVSNGSASNGRI
ncbi:hypothetical protein ScPMuIL_002629 [Solemya velum]